MRSGRVFFTFSSGLDALIGLLALIVTFGSSVKGLVTILSWGTHSSIILGILILRFATERYKMFTDMLSLCDTLYVTATPFCVVPQEHPPVST